MKIGGMIIYFAIFVSGIVLLIFYCRKFKHYDSPKGDMFNESDQEEDNDQEELIDITAPFEIDHDERNNHFNSNRKDEKRKTFKQVHLFIKSCSLIDNIMSSMEREYDNILRPNQSSYTIKMIKEIFFPQKDINFYRSIVSNETEHDIFNMNEWKKHIDMKMKKYERHHSFVRILPTFFLNFLKVLMHYFGIILTPSNLFKKQYTLYAKYLLRRKYSLPHQTEVDLKNGELLLDGIISLTKTNQFSKAVMKSLKLFVVGAFVIIFMLNIRSEFQIFGISSAVLSNLLLTIVIVCYDSSEQEVFEKTYTVAKRELIESLPGIKPIFQYQQSHNAIETITTSLYKSLYQVIIDEIVAPFKARKVLNEFKNYEYDNKYNEIVSRVIKPVVSSK